VGSFPELWLNEHAEEIADEGKLANHEERQDLHDIEVCDESPDEKGGVEDAVIRESLACKIDSSSHADREDHFNAPAVEEVVEVRI